MKWTPITEKLPKLDTPILVTIQYDGDDYRQVTDTELFNDPCSTINPCFNMGSAKNYKIFSWCYQPQPDLKTNSYVECYEMVWNEFEKTNKCLFCNTCQKFFSSKTSSTSLINHLLHKHKGQEVSSLQSQQS